MDARDAELLARLLPTFRLEAEEHLRQIDRLLTRYGKQADRQALEEAYREVHSLKGAARAVGAGLLENLCQEMESVFAAIRREELPPTADLLDVLHLAADLAADLAATAGGETSPELRTLAAETGRRLTEAVRSGGSAPPCRTPPPEPGQSRPKSSALRRCCGSERKNSSSCCCRPKSC